MLHESCSEAEAIGKYLREKEIAKQARVLLEREEKAKAKEDLENEKTRLLQSKVRGAVLTNAFVCAGLGFYMCFICFFKWNPCQPEADIEEEAQERAEGAYEAKHLGVSPGKRARLGLDLDADKSSFVGELAPAVLANIPSKCERCGSATAWMNDKYRPGLLFVYCTRFRSRGPGCNWSTHKSATDPMPEGSSSNPSPAVGDGAPPGLH